VHVLRRGAVRGTRSDVRRGARAAPAGRPQAWA
jgi:hypothetical protein